MQTRVHEHERERVERERKCFRDFRSHLLVSVCVPTTIQDELTVFSASRSNEIVREWLLKHKKAVINNWYVIDESPPPRLGASPRLNSTQLNSTHTCRPCRSSLGFPPPPAGTPIHDDHRNLVSVSSTTLRATPARSQRRRTPPRPGSSEVAAPTAVSSLPPPPPTRRASPQAKGQRKPRSNGGSPRGSDGPGAGGMYGGSDPFGEEPPSPSIRSADGYSAVGSRGGTPSRRDGGSPNR